MNRELHRLEEKIFNLKVVLGTLVVILILAIFVMFRVATDCERPIKATCDCATSIITKNKWNN